MKNHSLLAVAALFLLTALMGCETTKGVGKDVENAGKKMEDVVK